MTSTFNLSAPLIATTAAGALTLLGVAWVWNDYSAWKTFGTGGTPPTFQGYIKINKFRVLRAWSGDDLKDASRLPTDGPSYLKVQLPKRRGPAPRIIARTLPQRQYPEPLDPAVVERLHNLPHKYVDSHGHLLTLDKSFTEGYSADAIYARPELPGRKHGAQDRILGHELAHVHPSENSLHVWLTKADARKVIEAGWGERFPLSALGMTDDGWTFVYAPRSMEDVDVIETIVKAAIGHLTAEHIH